jgi:fucose permease
MMATTTTVTNTIQHPLEDIELRSIDHDARDATNNEDTSLTREAHNDTRDWKPIFQLISCGVSFFVAGVNDGSLGALLPYIIRSYGLTTAIASSV